MLQESASAMCITLFTAPDKMYAHSAARKPFISDRPDHPCAQAESPQAAEDREGQDYTSFSNCHNNNGRGQQCTGALMTSSVP